MKPLLDVFGFDPHIWPSVERTRNFYRDALQSAFELRSAERLALEPPFPAAALNFASAAGWSFDCHPRYPLAFAMHGGPVLDQPFLERRLSALETTDALIVNCRSDVALLQSMYAGAHPILCRLPLPVDSDLFRPGPAAEARAEIGAEEFHFLIGFVARFVPQKNFHRFLDLLASLNRVLNPLKVGGLAVGKYWLEYRILNFANAAYDRFIAAKIQALDLADLIICFAGDLADADLALCYRAMDFLYHPTNSADENFGYVPLEAQACGIPVIGAAYGGLKDTVAHNDTGWLLNTWLTPNGIRMNTIDLPERAAALLLDAERRRSMGAAGRERAVAHYAHDACARTLVQGILDAIAARNSGAAVAPCRLRPLAPCEGASDLPPVDPPWDTYRRPIGFYTSGPPPAVQPSYRAALAADLEHTEGDLFVSSDPAWPARLQLIPVERRIVQCCREPLRVSTILKRSASSLDDIRRLVERGVLICDTEGDAP